MWHGCSIVPHDSGPHADIQSLWANKVPFPVWSDKKDEGNFHVDSSIIQYVDELHGVNQAKRDESAT